MYVGLGVGLGILSLSILLVVFSNRASRQKPGIVAATDKTDPKPQIVAATDKAGAQQAPAWSLPLIESPLTPEAAPGAVNESKVAQGSVANEEGPIDPKETAGSPGSDPASEESDFAKKARIDLASATARTTPAQDAAPRTSPQPGVALSTAEIVARYEPSVALVDGKAGSGTGFLVAAGILATNSHVIDGEFINNLEIRFPSADEGHKGPVSAELLYEDPKRDLAFLAVKTDLPALQVAQSYRYRKGEDVTVIGNPGLDGDTVLENAISRGVMSTKAEIDGQQFYQLGIAVNPGNSGGPVFDSAGQVIGVVTLRIPGKEELSFCIPIEELRAGMARLRTQTPSLAKEVRSRHRTLAAFKNLGRAGALFGIVLELRIASRSNPADQDLKEKTKTIEEALPTLEQSLLYKLADEARGARNDPLLAPTARRKLGELADSFKSLKDACGKTGANTSVATIRSLKATHRRLVAEVGSELKVDVPKELLAALDDHLIVKGPSMVMESPVFPTAGSLRQRMFERHGITPPSLRGRPGFGTNPSSRFPGRISPRSRFGR